MKKGLSKLILSGAAVAACAATLGTSTYAWYTTNTEVSANNIIGASAGTGDASIFISGSGQAGTWKQNIDAQVTSAVTSDKEIVLGGSGVGTSETGGLQPVTYDETTNKWVNEKGNNVTTPTVITFPLYFKTSPTDDDVKIAVKSVKVENLTEKNSVRTLPTVENILDGSSYSVNILEALALKIGDYSATAANNTYVGCYSLTPGGIVSYDTTSGSYSAGTKVANYTAHEYVNEVVTGYKDPASQTPAVTPAVTETTTDVDAFPTFTATNESIAIATLPANGDPVQIPFTIFLDGADVDCFDACKGQSFKISLTFAIVKASA